MGRTKRDLYEVKVKPNMDKIVQWARAGVSDHVIADNLNVAYSTFRLYLTQHPEFREMLDEAKCYVDSVVVESAYLKRITGYDATETKKEYKYVLDEDTGEMVKMLVKETEQTRHVPGDPRAAEWWLSRRQTERWPAKVDDTSGDEERGGVVILPEVSGG